MENSLLGPYKFQKKNFSNLFIFFEYFNSEKLKSTPNFFRFKQICEFLKDLISQEPNPSFLLPAVLDFIKQVNERKILKDPFTFESFEFWLNHFSNLTELENSTIRGKIAGKLIPREEFQLYFPIGMGKVFEGTHIVSAHLSPDIDTMIASFIGWLDAFAARVGTHSHVWALPGGPPESPTVKLIQDFFGNRIFIDLARCSTTLSLKAIDLVTSENMAQFPKETLLCEIDHGTGEKAVLCVDKNGNYQGNWRSSDAEVVRQITILYKSCLHWLENAIFSRLIELLAKPIVTKNDLKNTLHQIFSQPILNSIQELNDNQKKHFDSFLKNIFKLQNGILSHFIDFNELKPFVHYLTNWEFSNLFDEKGNLKEDRLLIFPNLQEMIQKLDQTIQKMRQIVEQLGVAMKVKHQVLEHSPLFVPLQSDIEDMHLKIQHFDYLPVVTFESENCSFPIGIIRAKDLNKQILGTVSFRDFCSLDEANMSSYLSVISVIDHHKASLKTQSTPIAIVGDAQSCNVLLAELSFQINNRYSLGGMSKEEIEKELTLTNPCIERLLQKRNVLKMKNEFFVHPDREYIEYLLYLHAILDDTDLLTKVTNRDVECVANLLNRLMSLIERRDVEIIQLNDIPKNNNFSKLSAKRLLQNPDMYAFYAKIYEFKEKDTEENLKNFAIFSDTKEQNSCCRIGQTKIFPSNYPIFRKNRKTLRNIWLKNAEESFRNSSEIDLHIQMISTIPSAKEVFQNETEPYTHEDEIWIWCPENRYLHLVSFLIAFKNAPETTNNSMHLELLGHNRTVLSELFNQNFKKIPTSLKKENMPIAVLYFEAGTINSRKAMISPYLPKLIS